MALILFEGSLGLRFSEIRGLERVVRRLVGAGSLISGLVAGMAAYWLVGFGWELAALFGALMVVTGPTVVVPMLRAIRPSAAVSNVLRWEGIVIDPLGALLTVLVFEFIVASRGGGPVLEVLLHFLLLVAAGGLIGLAAGYLFGLVLRRHWLPEYLHNVVSLNLVFVVFAGANLLAEESGLLAVTVMGMVMANMRRVPMEGILDFKESLSLLLISALFVILAARIQPEAFRQLGWGAFGVFLAIQFLGRPLKVAYATWGSRLSPGERVLVAWIGPRGIVAAAIAALLALRLEEAGVPQAGLMVPLVFSIIIATVLVQGAIARPLARRLGVAEPEPNGLLIVGANRLARAVAEALNGQGFRTLLADSSREQVNAARMQGLSVFYGNPVSAHADRHLELVGLGRLLGLSPDPDLNALAALRYRGEFGAGEIYHLQSSLDTKGERRRAVALEQRGSCLFGADHNYAELDRMLADGAEIRATQLTEEFAFEDFHRRYWKRAVPLFAIDPRARLRIFTAQDQIDPKPGWTVLALVLPDGEPEKDQTPVDKTA